MLIFKDTPIPPPGNIGSSKYGFDKLNIGEGLFIKDDGGRAMRRAKRAAYAYGKYHDQKFITRSAIVTDPVTGRHDRGLRIWRIA